MAATITSKIDPSSPSFVQNTNDYKEILEDHYSKLNAIANRPSKPGKVKKDRLSARERVMMLMDEDSFLELSALAAWGIKDNEFPAAGIITGVGKIKGVDCVVIANDSSVKGGTYIAEGIKKHLRALEIAIQNALPCVYLVDSGGVFLPDQSEVFADRFHFGRFFYYQSRLSAKGMPQIAVVMGSCTAGGAYVPAMSDEVIMVKKQGTVFIGGPPLVKAATGEEVSAEELGGADMHTSISGVADHLAENDEHALQICRNIFEHITQKNYIKPRAFKEPQYPAEEIYGLVPGDLRNPFDLKEVIARLVDGSEFQEFKARYGKTLITGFAFIKGLPV